MADESIASFSNADYKISKHEVLYQGVFRLARYELQHRLFNGGMSQTISREVLERKSAVGVLPYDPVLDQVVLIEQFRVGAMSDPESPWMVELVAGVFDADETPPEVAKREATEEANCEILDLFPICEYFVSPGGSNEYIHLYCGRIDASEAGGIHGLQDENEDIRAFTVSADEAFALAQENKLKNAPTIITLQWLQLNREWLRQLWQTK